MPYSCPTCQLIRFMRLCSTFITLFANTRGVKCNFFKVFIDNKPYRFMLHFSIFVPLNIKKKIVPDHFYDSVNPSTRKLPQKFLPLKSKHFNSLHPNINMHILHTVLYTFLKVLTRRICLTVAGFCNCGSFPQFS